MEKIKRTNYTREFWRPLKYVFSNVDYIPFQVREIIDNVVSTVYSVIEFILHIIGAIIVICAFPLWGTLSCILYRKSLAKWLAKMHYNVHDYDHWTQIPTINTCNRKRVDEKFEHMKKRIINKCKSRDFPEKAAYKSELMESLEAARHAKIRELDGIDLFANRVYR